MAVYKDDKTNTWRVIYRYTDWNGERKQSQKRGFKTKREAQAWEREQLNKAQGTKSQYRGLGSIDFQAAARSVLLVARVKDRPEIRVMAHVKSSLAPEGEPVAFELSEENGFRWIGHFDISIDDLLHGISREKKSEMAEALLLDCLAEGKYPQQVLLKKAQNMGISKRVLDEAKKALNVRSVKEGNQWYWKLPDGGCIDVE